MRPRREGSRWWPLVVVLLVVWSARGAHVDLAMLFGPEGRAGMARFIGGLFPPVFSLAYLADLVGPAIETVQMSLVGVAFGALIAAPLAYFATRSEAAGSSAGTRIAYHGSRGVLNVMRTVPDLVWALVFIAAVGLGPFAGALALTVHSAGLLGKLYAEAMESVDAAPVEAVAAMGVGRFKTMLWAVSPQAEPAFVSVTLYQWECNIRSAMVMGFVGAGGLGQRIDLAMRLFRYDEMITLLAVLLLLVAGVDRLSAWVRRRLVAHG